MRVPYFFAIKFDQTHHNDTDPSNVKLKTCNLAKNPNFQHIIHPLQFSHDQLQKRNEHARYALPKNPTPPETVVRFHDKGSGKYLPMVMKQNKSLYIPTSNAATSPQEFGLFQTVQALRYDKSRWEAGGDLSEGRRRTLETHGF